MNPFRFTPFGNRSSEDNLPLLFCALPVAGAGLWLGGRIHSTLSRLTYVRVISLVLFASGLTLLIKD
ncbi:MAG: hypothetical protein EXQ87_08960 [Alphaproteobacteria bacterium]|nr:hypothetical protein [Alphaproteobacteria bacterium]